MNEETEGEVLPKEFRWEVLPNGTWDYTNGTYRGVGHFITVNYKGAHGDAGITDHELHLGDVMGMAKGKCWRVKGSPNLFECWGIAMGWFEDGDGVLVQITGTVFNIGNNWNPGSRCYLPRYGFGKPDQYRSVNSSPLGIAISPTNMVLVPGIAP